MVYQIGLDMGHVEYAVKAAITKLSTLHETFSLEDIALEIGCSPKTVWTACKRLQDAGIVKRTGSKRKGYRYIVLPESPRRKPHAEEKRQVQRRQEKEALGGYA